jgi:hypothetical protein
MNETAENGDVEVVKWLHENWSEGCIRPALTEDMARFHLEVVEWLFQHTWKGYFARAFDDVASNGYLKILELLETFRD